MNAQTWEAANTFNGLCLRFGAMETLCGTAVNLNTKSVIIDNIANKITCPQCAKIAHNFKIPTAY